LLFLAKLIYHIADVSGLTKSLGILNPDYTLAYPPVCMAFIDRKVSPENPAGRSESLPGQAALYGVLAKIRGTNLKFIPVNHIDPQ